jgi:prepilin signal peptidase PulO-like enzyme (type II secretory pathway)
LEKGGGFVNLQIVVCVILLGLNAIQDLRKREILLVLTVCVAAIGLLWQILVLRTNLPILLASVLPGVSFMALSYLSEGKVGFGDGILIAAFGIWAGFPSILYVVSGGLFAALVTGAVLAVRERRKQGKSDRKIAVPFVPFLFGAYISALLVAYI